MQDKRHAIQAFPRIVMDIATVRQRLVGFAMDEMD